MSWIFNGAGSFEKLPVHENGPRTCHSERSEESQNECAEAKHIKIQDFSCLTTSHCNSIFALLLSFPKSLNFLLSPQTLPVSRCVSLFNCLEICVNCRETDFNPVEIKFNKEETIFPVQIFIS